MFNTNYTHDSNQFFTQRYDVLQFRCGCWNDSYISIPIEKNTLSFLIISHTSDRTMSFILDMKIRINTLCNSWDPNCNTGSSPSLNWIYSLISLSIHQFDFKLPNPFSTLRNSNHQSIHILSLISHSSIPSWIPLSSIHSNSLHYLGISMSELQTFRRSYIPPLPSILTKDVCLKNCEALGAAGDHGIDNKRK